MRIRDLEKENASLRKERDSLAVRLAKADEEVRYQAAAVVEEIGKRDEARAKLAASEKALDGIRQQFDVGLSHGGICANVEHILNRLGGKEQGK